MSLMYRRSGQGRKGSPPNVRARLPQHSGRARVLTATRRPGPCLAYPVPRLPCSSRCPCLQPPEGGADAAQPAQASEGRDSGARSGPTEEEGEWAVGAGPAAAVSPHRPQQQPHERLGPGSQIASASGAGLRVAQRADSAATQGTGPAAQARLPLRPGCSGVAQARLPARQAAISRAASGGLAGVSGPMYRRRRSCRHERPPLDAVKTQISPERP